MKLREVLAMRHHGSSGELLNLNDSGTSFTVAAVQITSEKALFVVRNTAEYSTADKRKIEANSA